MNRNDAIKLIATSTFRPFRKDDWMCFGGCEDREPLICDSREDYLIIIDGNSATFYVAGDEDYFRFELKA